VDDRSVPCPGPITLQVADIYGKAVRGQLAQYKNWCELA
jgi:branched-chain amino acid aminotransferase